MLPHPMLGKLRGGGETEANLGLPDLKPSWPPKLCETLGR